MTQRTDHKSKVFINNSNHNNLIKICNIYFESLKLNLLEYLPDDEYEYFISAICTSFYEDILSNENIKFDMVLSKETIDRFLNKRYENRYIPYMYYDKISLLHSVVIQERIAKACITCDFLHKKDIVIPLIFGLIVCPYKVNLDFIIPPLIQHIECIRLINMSNPHTDISSHIVQLLTQTASILDNMLKDGHYIETVAKVYNAVFWYILVYVLNRLTYITNRDDMKILSSKLVDHLQCNLVYVLKQNTGGIV
jgi:hypothetical protein